MDVTRKTKTLVRGYEDWVVVVEATRLRVVNGRGWKERSDGTHKKVKAQPRVESKNRRDSERVIV